MIDLGDGVTVRLDERGAHVYLNGAYRFTCVDIDEARRLKSRALA